MSTRGLLAEAAVTDPSSGLLPLIGHTVHWTLTYGSLVALLVLLVAARPRRAATVRRPLDVREQQLVLLRTATAPVAPRGPATAGAVSAHSAHSAAGAVRAPGTVATWTSTHAASRTWLPVAVVGSAAAAGVHAAAGPQHFAEGWLVGAFFVASALAQLGWAAAVTLSGPRRWLLWGALVGNAGVVGLWLVSRTAGIPGLGGAEPIGPWDLAATTWELAVIGGVSLVLSSPGFGDNDASAVDIVRWSAVARTWLMVSVVVLAVLTVAGTSG